MAKTSSQWEFCCGLNKDRVSAQIWIPCVLLIMLLFHLNLCLYLGFELQTVLSSMGCPCGSWPWSLLRWLLNATSTSKQNRHLWRKGKPPVSRTFAEISKNVACLRAKGNLHMALESFRRSLENARLRSASSLRWKQLILFCCCFSYGLKLN